MVGALLKDINNALPNDYTDSKDWRDGGTVGRIEWLKAMFEHKSRETDMLWDWLSRCAHIDTIGVGVDKLRTALVDYVGNDVVRNFGMADHCMAATTRSAEEALRDTAEILASLTGMATELALSRDLLAAQKAMQASGECGTEYGLVTAALKKAQDELDAFKARNPESFVMVSTD